MPCHVIQDSILLPLDPLFGHSIRRQEYREEQDSANSSEDLLSKRWARRGVLCNTMGTNFIRPCTLLLRKRDVLAVSTVEGDLRDRAVCVHDLFKWTRPVATSAYVTFAEC